LPLLDALTWLAEIAPDRLAPTALPARWQKHRRHTLHHRPHGLTAVITPFNFPLLIACAQSAAALLSGCPVLLKPSEHAPLSARRAVELAHRAGIPTEVFGIVLGDGELGRALLTHGVRAAVFVGSLAHGQSVARTCAERMIPCSLELGGNCPLLALPGADLARVARAVVFGSLANSGQSCVAVGKVVVAESMHDELVERLTALIEPLQQGDPTLGPVELGALTTKAQLRRADEHVADATRQGARLVLGGEISPRPGNFYRPTLLERCQLGSRILAEETFAPVIAITPFSDRQEALGLANVGEHGLAAYVFGAPEQDAAQLSYDLASAHVLFDDVLSTYVCPELPLAPQGTSGLGVIHGPEGLLWHTTPAISSTTRFALPARVQFAAPASPRVGSLARWSSSLTRRVLER
jgi:acyl-CoA reductase-like NAD-dependent aldehyde dehydrogenase